MAKSTRSKVKRHYRAKKRETGVYAAHEAARLERLSSKLAATRDNDRNGDFEVKDVEDVESDNAGQKSQPVNPDSMELDAGAANSSMTTKKISTHGPRGSRREEWRVSKGMTRHAESKGMNRQGGIGAKRRAGRPKRRR